MMVCTYLNRAPAISGLADACRSFSQGNQLRRVQLTNRTSVLPACKHKRRCMVLAQASPDSGEGPVSSMSIEDAFATMKISPTSNFDEVVSAKNKLLSANPNNVELQSQV